MMIVVTIILLAIPVFTIFAIIKKWRFIAICLYVASLVALVSPHIGAPPPHALARARITTNIYAPYRQLIDHLSNLASEERHDELHSAIQMMKADVTTITQAATTNTFAQSVQAIIERTANHGIEPTGDTRACDLE